MKTKQAAVYILAAVLAAVPPAGIGQERHEIEVLGTKIPFREDPRKDMIVIEGEALRRLPAFQLAELVSLVANVNFAVRGLFQADPQMQGFNQEQIAVLVDGIPVNNAQTGHHNFLLPVAAGDIARIEVLRGGFSSRFGSSGGGGQVNIVTGAGNRLTLRRSSFGTTEASISAGSEALRAAAGYAETAGYAEGLDGRRAFVRGGGRWSGNNAFLDMEAGFVGAGFGASRFYGPYPSGETVSRLLGSVSGAVRLGPGVSGQARVSGQASRDDFLLYRDDPEKYRNIHETRQLSAEAGLRGAYRLFDYSLGWTTTADRISSDGIRGGLSVPALGRHQRIVHSIRGSVEKEAGGWSWRAGLDAGFGAYRGLGGSLVLGRELGQTFRLSGAIARTFRVPTYTELYYSDPAHLSDPSLSAERTDSASLSVDGRIDRLSFGGRVFRNRTEGLIDWIRPDGGTVWRSANIASGTFAGIDIRAEWAGEHVMARILYTYQKTKFSAGPGAELKYHFYFPDHGLSLIVSGDLGPWSGSAALKAEREESSGRVRPYLSVRLRRKLGRMELFADVQNLFNQRVEKVPELPEAPRSAGLGLGFDF